jgi:aspartyl/asparaginyl beta-hydroxylase (cupin superfamily)
MLQGTLGVRCQCSAQPLAKKPANLIEKETDELQTSNVQHRRTKEEILSIFLKGRSEATSINIQFAIFNLQFGLAGVR